MGKFRLFIENFLIYGLGGIISKVVPLIMVPVVARLMPDTTYFGISDLSNTVVQFGSAVAVMGMYDAMYRMFFEKEDEEYKKKICSTALMFTLFMSVIVFLIILFGRKLIAQYFFGGQQYAYLVYITAIATLVGATNSIISAPTRMQNKRRVFLIVNTISPILSYAISIPLLLKGYYIIALPLAAVISGVTMEIGFGILNCTWFTWSKFDRKLLTQLLKIAVPLVPNFLIYWLFNSCDRVMIANMMDVGAAGIYSVGAKLGQVSQLIYMAFTGGWQYFAFSTMKEKDQVKSNSAIFEYLGSISFIATMFVCAGSNLIYNILFTGNYIKGYMVSPYLFLAPLLQMLFQVAANQFLVIKKTWPNMFILSGGAILNIIANLTLIPVLGIEGAAIATLLGYAVSDIVCVVFLCKMKLMVISKRFLMEVILTIGFMITWRIFYAEKAIVGICIALVITVVFLWLYRSDFERLIQGIRRERYGK